MRSSPLGATAWRLNCYTFWLNLNAEGEMRYSALNALEKLDGSENPQS